MQRPACFVSHSRLCGAGEVVWLCSSGCLLIWSGNGVGRLGGGAYSRTGLAGATDSGGAGQPGLALQVEVDACDLLAWAKLDAFLLGRGYGGRGRTGRLHEEAILPGRKMDEGEEAFLAWADAVGLLLTGKFLRGGREDGYESIWYRAILAVEDLAPDGAGGEKEDVAPLAPGACQFEGRAAHRFQGKGTA